MITRMRGMGITGPNPTSYAGGSSISQINWAKLAEVGITQGSVDLSPVASWPYPIYAQSMTWDDFKHSFYGIDAVVAFLWKQQHPNGQVASGKALMPDGSLVSVQTGDYGSNVPGLTQEQYKYYLDNGKLPDSTYATTASVPATTSGNQIPQGSGSETVSSGQQTASSTTQTANGNPLAKAVDAARQSVNVGGFDVPVWLLIAGGVAAFYWFGGKHGR